MITVDTVTITDTSDANIARLRAALAAAIDKADEAGFYDPWQMDDETVAPGEYEALEHALLVRDLEGPPSRFTNDHAPTHE